MKKIILLFFTLQIHCSYATPALVEFVFLSDPSKSALLNLINKKEKFQSYSLLSKIVRGYECEPMGEGCFHPQLGYIEGSEISTDVRPDILEKKSVVIEEKEKLEIEEPEPVIQTKTFNNYGTSLISCKENYYFDMFCGKSKKILKGNHKLEIWIDTSTSMRSRDYTKDFKNCRRQEFISKIRNACGQTHALISTFDTSIKELGSSSNVCINHGSNNLDRLIDWIEGSVAKRLIIVTDIDEMSAKLRIFIDKIGAAVHGADFGDFDSKKLVAFAEKNIINSCK